MGRQATGKGGFFYRIIIILLVFSLLSSGTLQISHAQTDDPPEEYRGKTISSVGSEGSAVIQEESFGIAWGDPDGPHSVYSWPFTFVQMGHAIQSYQNYSSGTSAAYFHHGIDMIAPNGTQVYTRSGGQVVNVENYQPGQAIYWEVAILDAEGYVWQYHHIDEPTIPDLIYQKFAEWQADPVNGGYIPPNTHIGNIVYWPVTSFGYRFNHIHLNILAAGDVYLNAMEFHTPIEDTQAPEIQAIGLLNGNTIVSGNTASGNYGMYVRARDLYKSTVYYLPPYKTEFSVDGGDWVTVWEFHDFPGGFDDQVYVNDFFVPVVTKGDYNYRDFYIDLGFTTGGQRAFTSEPGEHTIAVRVWDYAGNSDTESFTYNVVSSIPDNGCSSGNGVTRTFQVTEELLVTDVNLGINLTHTTRGQVRVTLKSPTDTTATTIINTSTDSYDNYDMWVDDSSSNPVNDNSNDTVAAPYFDRTAGPSTNGSLDSFNGKSALGTWIVFICDNTSGTTGTVNLIDLEVIGVVGGNEAPIADDQSVSTSEDTALGVTLTGSDPDGDQITFIVIDQPMYGTLSGEAPDLTYTPASNYYGTDSFTFKVNDGTVDSNTATVSITVIAVNDAPVANNQSVNTAENTAKSITLTGTDIDGDSLTYTVESGPSHGSLSGTAPNLTYTPATNYNGPDSFTFKVNDGAVDSNTATVSITVTPVNDAPVAISQSVSTAEDMAKAIVLTGSDGDGDPLTYSIVAQPLYGTLSGSAPNVTYIAAANYNGSDSFTFKVNDGVVDSNTATVSITVTPVNDAPVANGQSVSTAEDTAKGIVLTGSDVDGNPLTYSIVAQPLHGSLSGSAPNVTYTPAANYNGSDSFTFKVYDGEVDSNTATVNITVTPVNDAPVANSQSVNTAEDSDETITLSGSDIEGSPLTYSVVTPPAHGSLSGIAPNLTYTPTANYYGPDSFTFKVNDGALDSSPATVSIVVTPVNDAPVANAQSVSTSEDTAMAITLSGSDVDGDSLSFTVQTGPSHGSLSGNAPNLTYTPTPSYTGSDSFTFTVYDGTIASSPATVSINVTEVNHAPVADDQSVTTSEDTAKAITLVGSDPDGGTLTYSVVDQPAHGSLSSTTGPDLTYTPGSNYYGTDSFTFKVNDGQVDSNTATISITVTAVNDAPVANPQSVSTAEDTAKAITLSGSDIEGSPLTYEVLTPPAHGSLSGSAPNLTYTPAANYNGPDSFSFKVNDGTVDSSPATVSITVTPVNDAPVANMQAVETNENSPLSILLSASDIDGDSLDYVISTTPAHGTLSGTAPNLTYTPNIYYSGPDAFTFYVTDGQAISNTASVTIVVRDLNFLPIVYSQSLSTNENTPLSITLIGMDPDGDAISFFTKVLPEYGELTGTAPNLIYTPDPGYTGSDSFTFAASDQEGESNEGVISIQVTPSGPLNIFFDDFETNLGWVRDPYGTDTATLGYFERANPDSVAYYGDKQLGTTVSGSYDLVTGPLAGSSAGAYDLDGGKTSFLSPAIELPTGRDLEMSFSYYVSHYTNSSTADYLRVYIIGESTVKVFEELGANNDDDAVWATFNGDISSFAGQTVRILIEAADASTASYFEAAVDDVGIVATTPNNPPVAEGKSYELAEDTSLAITLAGSDPDGNPITFRIGTTPLHGSLSGTAPNLVYTPASNYNGSDSFTFVVNDGKLDSVPATISLDITAVNDVPIALAQTVSTTVNVPVSIVLSGTDAEGNNLTYHLVTQPTQGALTGTAPDLVYTPASGFTGTDSFQFLVNDGNVNSSPAVISLVVNPAGPQTIFWDDFESNNGWVFNPFGTDTATSGTWQRANPEVVSYYGYKQLGTTVSGSYDLVTGPLAGSSSGSYDLDGGLTSVRSPQITLPTGRDLTLSFSYYLAHYTNSSTADYLRIKIVGSTTTTLFQELGANNDDDAVWQTFSISLNSFAGQTVYLLIEAADASTASLVEAAIDDVLIIAE